MTQIRMLQNSFSERLAVMNVLPADDLEKNAIDNARYQIDERGFSEFLRQQAQSNGRTYGAQNRENDARYLGAVVRLRRRLNTRDLANCGYIFVTHNRFLAQISRRYLIEQRVIQPQHCPPILSVGQIATIAWLMKDQALEPDRAGRELLSSCFAAVRPDQEWFRYFREGIEVVTGNIEEFGRDPGNALTLQAARRIAQEESFGESLVVRELNMAEILSRAEQENRRIIDERDAQAAADQEAAVRNAVVEATWQADARHREQQRASAYRKADRILRAMKVSAVGLFILISGLALYLQWLGRPSITLWVSLIFLLAINVLSFMDLIGVVGVGRCFMRVREWIATVFMA